MRRLGNRKQSGLMERAERRAFYAFIAPWLFGTVGLLAFPLIWGLVISLFDYTGLNINALNFVGLENYRRAFSDPQFFHGLRRTLYLAFVAVPLRIVIGFVIAGAMIKVNRGVGVFRTIFYLPVLIPAVAAVHIWAAIFNPNAGLINSFVRIFGLPGRTNWMLEYPSELLVLLFVWGLGETVVIFFAALQGIPDELTEAAAIDGAGSRAILARLILPLVTPIIFFQFLLNLVRGFQLLAPALLLVPRTAGGLADSGVPVSQVPVPNRLVLIHIYDHAFQRNNFSYALAMSWVFFVLIVALVLLNWRLSKYWVYYEVDADDA